jgi:outer membrane protein assembly factor BamB
MKNFCTIGALLTLCCLTSGQDWPQWRGPNRDNRVMGFDVPKEWPKELTKQWSVTVGEGHSSPVLVGDKVYVFARQGEDEVTLCLDAASGKEIWNEKYGTTKIKGPAAGKKNEHTGTRSTPAVGEGKVCTLGVAGVVSCLDAATGKKLWRDETGTKPKWFTSTSPLIADGMCVVFAKGLTAYDLATGAVKWKWSGDDAPYGSPVVMSVGGIKQVVTPTAEGTLVGVRLADGKLLWQTASLGTGYTANYSTPMISGSKIFYSAAAKGAGGNIFAFEIEKEGDDFKAKQLWKKAGATAGYHCPVFKNDMIFGVSTGRKFFCLDAGTGKELWTDTTARGECGCILDVGPVLIALTSDTKLIAFQADKNAYKEVAKYEVASSPTWSVPILAGKRIFVKDKTSLTLWTID